MEIENQVTSLELAQKVKELKFEQKSLWVWIYCKRCSGSWNLMLRKATCTLGNAWDYDNKIPTYTVAELGEMLPYGIVSGKTKTKYCCQLAMFAEENNNFDLNLTNRDMWDISEAETEVDARAKMLIYLKENNLLKEEK